LNILDDLNQINLFDPTKMSERISNLPTLLKKASSQNIQPSKNDIRNIRDVIFAGMGGSAIAANIVLDYIGISRSIPMTVNRQEELPYKPSNNTLLIINSFSGNTEETINIFKLALKTSCKIIVVTSGGKLLQLASENNIETITMTVTGEPRSVVPYHLVVLINLLSAYHLLEIQNSDINAIIKLSTTLIKTYGIDNPTSDNLAKQLANNLKNKLICVYGGGIFTSMSLRWKTQINENAKTACISDTIPELLHNTIESFQKFEQFNDSMFFLVLQPSNTTVWLQEKYKTLKTLFETYNLTHEYLQIDETDILRQIISMMILCDYTSYYLAILKSVDPSTNDVIDSAKKMMS
jgi:glucose/mannose-6-phosphate isomerase